MKRIVAGLLVALSFNVLAVDAVTLLRPSPLGVVIAVKSYLKDQKKVYYIRVESQARDFEQAKKQAFRLASEQVAGTVVLSESELRNSNLTRDEIITYSSGLIDEYKIVDRFDAPGSVKLTMDVWIVESVMAQRLLAKSAQDQRINGDALATRTDSILDERRRGDTIVQAVVRDMPRHGFAIKMKPAKISMDVNRNTIASVVAYIEWDPRYVNALSEAAISTGLKPNPLCWSNCPNINYALQGAGFEDPVKLHMVIEQARNLTVSAEVQDASGQTLSRICQPLLLLQEQTKEPNPMIIVGSHHVALNTKAQYGINFVFYLGQNTAMMARLDEIRTKIVTNSQCRPL